MSIDQRDRPKAMKLMKWVLFAARPMTIAELEVALALLTDFDPSFETLHNSSRLSHDSGSFKR